MILRKTTASNLLILILITVFYGCSAPKEESKTAPKQVLLETNYGEILLELSDKTPLHRDNFLKLVEAGDFDSLLFHRVIEGFVIQGGDPESKYANPGDTLGEGDKNYTVPAELDTSLFHKRGALGAAREGRPDRASSAMQFYIVQSNKSIADSLFAKAENRINSWLQTHHFINTPENKAWLDSLNALLDAKELDAFYSQMDSVTALSKSFEDFDHYEIPESHREVYRASGGVPHLDQNYTIFGEVIQGMNVVDSIAALATDPMDRPTVDARIISAKVVGNK